MGVIVKRRGGVREPWLVRCRANDRCRGNSCRVSGAGAGRGRARTVAPRHGRLRSDRPQKLQNRNLIRSEMKIVAHMALVVRCVTTLPVCSPHWPPPLSVCLSVCLSMCVCTSVRLPSSEHRGPRFDQSAPSPYRLRSILSPIIVILSLVWALGSLLKR